MRDLARLRLSMQRLPDGAETLLLVTPDGRHHDAARMCAALGLPPPPASVDAALQLASPAADAQLLAAWQAAAEAGRRSPGLVDAPRIAPLFRRPGKILCVGQNFRRHAEEMGAPLPKWPVLFSKFNNSLAGDGDEIALLPREVAFKYDYETELVAVVGETIRAGDQGALLDRVAGYCIGHDLTARDLQKERGGQWLLGKTLDGFAPIGPDLVGSDLAGDCGSMAIETRRNGVIVQSSTTADFIFPVEQVLRYAARHFTLQPGDLVFTGTPEGVIAGKPAGEQHWLVAGDVIESRVGKLGTLHFRLR